MTQTLLTGALFPILSRFGETEDQVDFLRDSALRGANKQQPVKVFSYDFDLTLSGCDLFDDGSDNPQFVNMRWEPAIHKSLGELSTSSIMTTKVAEEADVFHIPACFSKMYYTYRGGCSEKAKKKFTDAQDRIIDAMRKIGGYFDAGRPHIVSKEMCDYGPELCEGFDKFWPEDTATIKMCVNSIGEPEPFPQTVKLPWFTKLRPVSPLRTPDRKDLFVFVGGVRNMRGYIPYVFENIPGARIIKWTTTMKVTDAQKILMNSQFAFSPVGDAIDRKATYDTFAMGAIPVFSTVRMTFPFKKCGVDFSKISITLDLKGCVLGECAEIEDQMNLAVQHFKGNSSATQVLKMQKAIAAVQQLFQYGSDPFQRCMAMEISEFVPRGQRGVGKVVKERQPNTKRIAATYALSLPEENANFLRLRSELQGQGLRLSLWPGVRLAQLPDAPGGAKERQKLVSDDFRLTHYLDAGVMKPLAQRGVVGNYGLALAHLTLWEQLHTWLPDDGALALIFEDDEHLLDGFKEKLDRVLASIDGPVDFINLNTLRPTGVGRRVDGFSPDAHGRYLLFRVSPRGHKDPDLDADVWLSAYAVSKAGIGKLLEGLKKHPINSDLAHGIIDHCVGWVVENTPSIAAYAIDRNAISFHNETVSFRNGQNDGLDGPEVQKRDT